VAAAGVMHAFAKQRFFATSLASLIILALVITSWRQTWNWSDSHALYMQALRVNRDSAIAHNNLVVLLSDVNPAEAEEHARRLAELQPDSMWPKLHLGLTLARAQRFEDAANTFREASRRWPESPQPHIALAAALLDLNRPDEAVAEYDAAMRINPATPQLQSLRNRAILIAARTKQNAHAPAPATTQP
jgi:tetratricopeptide (TPR) repeat protein